MSGDNGLKVFLEPRSVAVIGATQRPGSWGSFIMGALLSLDFPGRIYPVNRSGGAVFGVPASRDIRAINDDVDLAILTIPEEGIEDEVIACGQKGVRGITIVAAGFGETSETGRVRQEALAKLAGSMGIRLLGPNVSGAFNLLARFNASPCPARLVAPKPIAAVCQGSFAFYDLLASGGAEQMGVAKFIQTGNECDVTVTDCLQHFGEDSETRAILMYVETIRDPRRFIKVAADVSAAKPIVAYKAGRTEAGARAAMSHTGALAGKSEIYDGFFRQAGVLACPTMELLLPLGHSLVERPPMRGDRVGIVTMGGSWGVALSEALEDAGLRVPEFSSALQASLRDIDMPERASTKNPVDFGASGLFLSVDALVGLGERMLSSGEIDALVLHGIGRPGMHDETTTPGMKAYLAVETQMIKGVSRLEEELGRPALIGSHHTPWQSQAIHEVNKMGIRVYRRLDEIANVLSLMRTHWQRRSRLGDSAR
jgi:acyl-CoA synthetase (NDP forming)